ncbi:uncharacterized protein M421DRAFT_387024 [Didymella exigua CBS 183.55]|uniref:F-box domain-containing protein n=1 Tax=Didymella exigua CBS 183.55 TaxID=1150837 RepID=A0A6A5RRY3_9PLEO|nr:uncharacterized protein M421DRAFT_387024 [Didymella exigua CBS 183.55]KAF1930203.1 hypothetical protein M421DRAFT_387024 [Didymella exigua CBS 183.55]
MDARQLSALEQIRTFGLSTSLAHALLPPCIAIPLQPFRFLDLPKDLRLMVYEQLPLSTMSKTFHVTTVGEEGERASLTLTRTALPVALLAVSKLTHQEALPFFKDLTDRIAPEIKYRFPSFPGDGWLTAPAHLIQLLICIRTVNDHGIRNPLGFHKIIDKSAY